MPVPDAIRWLAEHGEPADPRPDIDTASLVRRFPHLVASPRRTRSSTGPHGPVPIRVYRDATATPSGRALVWVHGGAFIGGNLDMPESNWVARELAARGIPVASVDYAKCLGDVHYPVPSDDVLAAWRHVRDAAEDLLGRAGRSRSPSAARARAERSRPAQSPGCATRGSRCRQVSSSSTRWCTRMGLLRSDELDPSSTHGQLCAELRGLRPRRSRTRRCSPASVTATSSRRRSSWSANAMNCARRASASPRRSRKRGSMRCSTSSSAPVTATSTSPATRPPAHHRGRRRVARARHPSP